MTIQKLSQALFLRIGFLGLMAISPAWAADELVLYSARTEPLIQPVLDAYTRETGVKVRLVTDSAEVLLQKLKSEGSATPADVLITVDGGNLAQAAELGVLVPIRSQILERNVPQHLRDPKGRWFSVSQRLRTIFYNPKKVDPSELSTYEALAGNEWKNRLCLRTSKKVYNQSLVAMMIAKQGEKNTEKVIRGWIANLATDVFSDDTKLLEAIHAGQCDVGIANTYYFGRLQKKTPDLSVRPFWPDQSRKGVHVNVSGAGVIAASKNKTGAQRFIEWLSQGEAQRIFAQLNLEHPVHPKAELDPLVRSWGPFKGDSTPVSEMRKFQATAVKVMDRAGYL